MMFGANLTFFLALPPKGDNQHADSYQLVAETFAQLLIFIDLSYLLAYRPRVLKANRSISTKG